MKLIDTIREYFRTQLPVDQSILDRERKFNGQDINRERWVLSHTYLCEGDLKKLKEPSLQDKNIGYIRGDHAYYATPMGVKGPCKKVIVSVQRGMDNTETIRELERKLKLDLFSRGCNSGVFYRSYEKNGKMFAEAVPAVYCF